MVRGLLVVLGTMSVPATGGASPPAWMRLDAGSPFLVPPPPAGPAPRDARGASGGVTGPSFRYPEYRRNREIALLVVGVGLVVAGELTTADVREIPPEGLDPADIGWGPDRRIVGQKDLGADAASDVLRTLAMVMPFALAPATLPAGDRWSGLGRRTLVYLEAALFSAGATNFGKQTIGRARPYAYLAEADRPDEPAFDVRQDRTFRSMPSGHASTAWTATSLATTEHLLTRPDASAYERLIVGFVGGALGGTTAALRVEAGQHFPSDVLVGSAIGIASGVTLPLLHAPEGGPSRRAWVESAAGQLLGATLGTLLATQL